MSPIDDLADHENSNESHKLDDVLGKIDEATPEDDEEHAEKTKK